MGKKKNKNYTKTFIKIADKSICVNDLVKAVNDYDKKYGIKLKHPEIWSDPTNYLQIISAKADMNLAALICCLNGVTVNEYFETDTETGYGTICKPVGIDYSCFTSSSILKWSNQKSNYRTDSLIFRCRYLTLILTQLMGQIELVSHKEVANRYKYKHSKTERQIMVTKDVMNYIIKFILIMISPEQSYQNIILKMHEYVSYTKKNVKHNELRNVLNKHVLTIRKCMKEDLLTERFMSDDLAIYNILKVSYMLATNKTNLDVIPNFKYIEGATVKHNLIKLIEELGDQIIHNTKDRKYSPMFRAFIEARPSVWSQFYKESKDNYAIQVGLLALSYTKFVLNDKTLDKFIDDMMKKGK